MEEDLKATGKPFRQQFHQLNNDEILPFDEETVGPGEFYDLKSDPNELVNLYGSSEHIKIQLQMQKNLDNWKKSLNKQ